MSTVVTIRFRTPPPSSVDETLLVEDDGTATLDVLRPRVETELVGRFAGPVTAEEAAALSSAGPAVDLDLVAPDPAAAEVSVVAAAVADRLRGTPVAAARFAARPYDAGGTPGIAISLLGCGSAPVELLLDAGRCALHFSAAGSPTSWVPLPEPAVGFVTVDAEGLGGVGRRAVVEPGVLGALSVPLGLPPGADAVSAQLAGLWFPPGATTPVEFEARTPQTGA